MIRKLLATTAIATLVASGAFAQSNDANQQQPAQANQPAQPDPAAGAADGQPAGADATAQTDAQQPADTTAQGGTAGTDQPAATADAGMADVQGHLASNLIGMRVYNGTNDDAESIGEVKDIVIGKDGKAELVVIGVGGFLGIGEKNVALEYASLEWAQREGDMWLVAQGQTKEQLEAEPEFDTAAYDPTERAADSDVAATQPGTTEPASDTAAMPPAGADATADADAPATEDTAATEPAEQDASGDQAAATSDQQSEQQEGQTDVTVVAPSDEVDVQVEEPSDQAAAGADDANREQTAATDQPAADATDDTAAATDKPSDEQMAAGEQEAADQTTTAAVDRSQQQAWDVSGVSADELIGTEVYGANNQEVGNVNDIILQPDNQQIDAVIVDVGGFLGIGAKQVAIGMDNVEFTRDQDGNRYMYTNFTKEQLEAQPEYDESSYAQSRDQQRMTVQ